MNFTFNNHLTYTIGDRLFGARKNPIEKFIVKVGKIDQEYYKKSNWQNEQKRTADDVYRNLGKDLIVFFSGGTDSEIVIRTFKSIGINVRCAFIRFKNDFNIEDYHIAKKIVEELDLKLEVIDVDIIDFYYSGLAWDLAQKIHCRQIAYLNVYYQIQKLSIPAVMGGEFVLKRHVDPSGSKWYYCFRENEDASAIRFSLKSGIPLVNEWFSYTPEMMAYYLEHPKSQWLINERYNYKMSSVSTKNEVLKSFVPDLFDKQKTHGFEKLMGFNMESYVTLYNSHVRRIEPSLDGIFIDDFKKQLGI